VLSWWDLRWWRDIANQFRGKEPKAGKKGGKKSVKKSVKNSGKKKWVGKRIK
jgi:hypothetical protein